MDVSVKVSLQGGHVWEFVCDEDDPMVLGLVSALPGASVDSSLPPDGLIQVEAKSGERMFLTRPSLVAVTIRRLGAAGSAAGPELRPGVVMPAPFAIVPDCFDAEALTDLLAAVALAPRSPAGSGAYEIDLRLLPELATNGLVAAVAEAAGALGLAAEETYLDVTFHAVAAGARPDPAGEARSREHEDDILAFVIHLPLEGEDGGGPANVALYDRVTAAENEAGEREPRIVSLGPNSLLAVPAGAARGPLERSTGGEALLVRGSLRRGAAGGRG